jgi:hypothetical protein
MGDIFDDHLPPVIPSKPRERTRSNRREVEPIATSSIRAGKIQLSELVGLAFDTLELAMHNAEWPIAVQAAKLVLDRAGFGPSSTLKIDDSLDLSELSDEELCNFALRLGKAMKTPSEPFSFPSESRIH